VELDTNDPVGLKEAADQVVNAEETISLPSRSLLVLRKTL
jgi:isoamylase